MVNITLPGWILLQFRISLAGPLIVALVLGQLRRTGPIVWTLPYGANLTLRQVGLIFLLAGIGIRSGQTFSQTIVTDLGWKLFPGGGHNCHRHHPRYPDYRLPNLAYSLQLSRRNGG
jgi:putative transport protein